MKIKSAKGHTDEYGVHWSEHSIFAGAKELYRDTNLTTAERFMHRGLLLAFDLVRIELDHPLFITSGRRSQTAQDILRQTNRRAALHSPHVAGVALDIMTPGYMRDNVFAEMMKNAVRTTCGILPRLGYVKYREGMRSSYFIHVDVAPAIWRKGMPDAWNIEGLIW